MTTPPKNSYCGECWVDLSEGKCFDPGHNYGCSFARSLPEPECHLLYCSETCRDNAGERHDQQMLSRPNRRELDSFEADERWRG